MTLSPVRHIVPISGKDSLCTALVLQASSMPKPYEYFFCDVRMELPETYEWLSKVEKVLNIRITRLGKSLMHKIEEKNILPSHAFRFCTRECKIYPLLDYLGKDECVQYLGIRADEAVRAAGHAAQSVTITNVFPLVEHGIDLAGVYNILSVRDLLPPAFFWPQLWDLVQQVLPDEGKNFLVACKPWVKNHLFSGRSRSNCFMCFYQLLYEWAWLLDVHPDLFRRAEEIEQTYGNHLNDAEQGRRLTKFTLRSDGYPLWTIRSRYNEIIKKRAVQVIHAVMKGVYQPADDEMDLLSVRSCGAYCGK